MNPSLRQRITNQIFKFDLEITGASLSDAVFTLDFERGTYRQSELVGLIRDIAPYFALTEQELSDLQDSERYRTAFTRISNDDASRKGDYGELMLFAILTLFYDAPKFVTKARLRSSSGGQIKGFDCAHFSEIDGEVQLWLGEAKFYKNFTAALASAYQSINDHLINESAIRNELKILGGNVEINQALQPQIYDKLQEYTNGAMSLDLVPIKVPVLITYDSDYIVSCNGVPTDIRSDQFRNSLLGEVNAHFSKITQKSWPTYDNISLVFILMPLHSVDQLKSDLAVVERAMKF